MFYVIQQKLMTEMVDIALANCRHATTKRSYYFRSKLYLKLRENSLVHSTTRHARTENIRPIVVGWFFFCQDTVVGMQLTRGYSLIVMLSFCSILLSRSSQ